MLAENKGGPHPICLYLATRFPGWSAPRHNWDSAVKPPGYELLQHRFGPSDSRARQHVQHIGILRFRLQNFTVEVFRWLELARLVQLNSHFEGTARAIGSQCGNGRGGRRQERRRRSEFLRRSTSANAFSWFTPPSGCEVLQFSPFARRLPSSCRVRSAETQPHGGIPGAVIAMQRPAPVRDEGQGDPDRHSESSSQMSGDGVADDHQIEVGA